MSGTTIAAGARELSAALADQSVRQIIVESRLDGLPELVLRPGLSLAGTGTLAFAPGTDGLHLRGNNEVTGLTVLTEPARRAVFTDPADPDLGLIRLRGLTVGGQVDLGVGGAGRI